MNSLAEATLTATQLDAVANDLRNAALVVEHTGHTRRQLINTVDGGACAQGAIELSTTHKLVSETLAESWVNFFGDAVLAHRDALLYRRDNAIMLFAEHVPMGLCIGCRPHTAVCECGCDTVDVFGIVTHYNDMHCASGDVLTGLLRAAADRAAHAAHERRTMLTGDRVPALV